MSSQYIKFGRFRNIMKAHKSEKCVCSAKQELQFPSFAHTV